MDNERNERKLVDYKTDETNITILKEIQEAVCKSLELEPDDEQGIRYANRAFKAVVKRVNNPYFNVLEEYKDEIIDIALYNHKKDKDSSGKNIVKKSQGPLSIEYGNSISSSAEIPAYLLESIRHFVGGFF